MIQAFKHYQSLPVNEISRFRSLLLSFTLRAWASYTCCIDIDSEDAAAAAAASTMTTANWRGTRSHSEWKYETLVPNTKDTRVSHLNGQTLRARGTSLIAVGRKKTTVHNLDPGNRSSSVDVPISGAFPIVQAAIHSSSMFWGARRSGGNFLFVNSECGNDITSNPAYDPKRHEQIPTFFGCDFLPDREPTLVLGCVSTKVGSLGAYQQPSQLPSCWLEAHRVTPDGSLREVRRWKSLNLDQCKGGVMTPLFCCSSVCCVGREHISLYDTRSRSKTCAMSLNVIRRSMGASGPARAAISPEGTYICAIMDRTINVYDFRCDRGSLKPMISMNFVADQRPVAVCWMPPTQGFSVASGNSTGDVVVHDVASGTHTGTLFNRLRAACVSLAAFDGGICSQNATGTVNMHGDFVDRLTGFF